ncbi:MAG: (deoxy)nucleoside triphosphate pyrophosphohydrolase [Rickettsiales bacterium]|nr:(deoxy)nucleoside triphosphate pyrophosphohydrolase [Rickettsiales bacterium]
MKMITVAAAALLDDQRRVLVGQRPEGKHMEGLWEFPGGKIEQGETPEAALVRELKEELQIKVTQQDLKPISFVSHAYEGFHLLMMLYGCTRWYGKVHANEHSDLKWTYADALSRLPMPPADAPLIEPLGRFMREK